VSIAVKGGNVPVLRELLAGGYELKWQQAQVNSNSSTPYVLEGRGTDLLTSE
jgi:hypothetical protein